MAGKPVNKKMEEEAVNKEIEVTVNEERLSSNEVNSVDVLMQKKKEMDEEVTPFNPLKKETVIVRYLSNGKFPDRKHVFHGGLADKGVISYCVPSLENGTLKNPLTNQEKAFFEDILGLEKNALSVYNKNNNFWSTANINGIGSVELKKQDNYFDLSNPTDWLKVRILEMHPGEIAKSYKDVSRSHRFVIVHDANEAEMKKNKQFYTKESWKLLGKLEGNRYALKYIIEKIEARPISSTTKLDVLSTKCGDLIESNAVMFYNIVTDKLFDTKVLMSRCVEMGLITRRNNYYYSKEGEPLCGPNQESVEEVAAQYLNMPKNQDLLFLLQEKVKEQE